MNVQCVSCFAAELVKFYRMLLCQFCVADVPGLMLRQHRAGPESYADSFLQLTLSFSTYHTTSTFALIEKLFVFIKT